MAEPSPLFWRTYHAHSAQLLRDQPVGAVRCPLRVLCCAPSITSHPSSVSCGRAVCCIAAGKVIHTRRAGSAAVARRTRVGRDAAGAPVPGAEPQGGG
jgi:hypothetical protein